MTKKIRQLETPAAHEEPLTLAELRTIAGGAPNTGAKPDDPTMTEETDTFCPSSSFSECYSC